jgi:amidase
VLQSSESWKTFEPWLDTCNPRLAFGVARNLVQGSMLTDAERGAAALMRIEARARVSHLLPAGTILCLPTTPFPAPLKGLPNSVLGPLRDRISCLTSHGGLTGVPQVSVPGATAGGAPVGLSIIAARGADLELMQVALRLQNS